MNHNLALLCISGDDAEQFLQGQLTNDVTLLADQSSWQFAAFCNPKGRAIAVFILWHFESRFFLLTDVDLLESVSKRLTMYVLRSKVKIEALDFQAHIIKENNTAYHLDAQSASLFQLAMGQAMLTIAVALENPPVYADDNTWKDLCVEHGYPWLTATTSEEFVPQMLNLDLVNGISFQKGCYTGQEIVARMHYLGKLKQRMYRVMFKSAHQVAPDARVQIKGSERIIGTILLSGSNGQALAVLRHEAIEDQLMVGDRDLQLDSIQPYPLD